VTTKRKEGYVKLTFDEPMHGAICNSTLKPGDNKQEIGSALGQQNDAGRNGEDLSLECSRLYGLHHDQDGLEPMWALCLLYMHDAITQCDN